MRFLIKRIGSILILSLIIFLAACNSEEASQSDDGKINVVTTISQLGDSISVIGGDRVEVESLMGPSIDPHLYNATQSDIATIEEADVIFYNGLELEANMIRIFEEIGQSKPVLAVGETIPEDSILEDEEEAGADDPHIWFDIDLWKQGLDAAVEELKQYSPEDADYFEANKQEYFTELDQLNEESEEKLAAIPEEQRVLVTAHDAFGYFGKKYDIEVIGLQGLSTEDEVGISNITETIEIIKEREVPAIFIESSISEDTIQAVIEGAESDGVNVSLGGELFSDAMGEPGTDEGTYIGMYRHNVDTIYEALSEGAE
ncbi:manganese/zinc/iron transport system substrate-binding protein [Virgibacillus natechei]|uniref:Manganese/zinc/iron transport system substrate-binding protein n=1 Tax=Virgibacillus natechei TaxID=1216297 RepID=A0ABS4IBQ2_9BACI|nr:zinc ABC transporter substrate-binding protein [Virgibacillus natechei]MBP1968369.1 manganese/zinc/iron transport system substrate-binding protein [Virgibacillus natechei]UZD13500.1 zinc ABC transporter substrate-binding protein [Virgibacillus natechei]